MQRQMPVLLQPLSLNPLVNFSELGKYLIACWDTYLGSLLFLIYINVLYNYIKFCQVHHLADDTNLFHSNECRKMLNELINYDMNNLTNQLNADIIIVIECYKR